MRRFITWAISAVFIAAPAKSQEPNQPETAAGARSYWIGAMCVPTEPTVRAQLQLGERGLTVVQVLPESPAGRGGLQVHDVLVQVNGKPLAAVEQLMNAVSAAGGKELKLEVVRGGKTTVIVLQPEQRPTGDVLRRYEARPLDGEQAERIRDLTEKMRQKLPEGEARQMQEWVEKFRRGEQLPLRMHMFGPGVVVHSTVGNLAAPLPDGVQVMIKKAGSATATITVERGDETWTLNDQELHRLPADLQGPVGAMLGQGVPTALKVHSALGHAAAVATSDAGPVQIQIQTENAGPKGLAVPPPQVVRPLPPTPQPAAASPPQLELERLKKQVELLQRRLDEMQKGAVNK